MAVDSLTEKQDDTKALKWGVSQGCSRKSKMAREASVHRERTLEVAVIGQRLWITRGSVLHEKEGLWTFFFLSLTEGHQRLQKPEVALFDFLVGEEGFPRAEGKQENQMAWMEWSVKLKWLEAEQSALDLVEFTGEWDEGPQTQLGIQVSG